MAVTTSNKQRFSSSRLAPGCAWKRIKESIDKPKLKFKGVQEGVIILSTI